MARSRACSSADVTEAGRAYWRARPPDDSHKFWLRPLDELPVVSPREQSGVDDRFCHLPAQTLPGDMVGAEMLSRIDSAQSRFLGCS